MSPEPLPPNPHPQKKIPAFSQLWEWVAEGIKPEIDNPQLQNLAFDDFFPRWYENLSQGKTIAGKVKDFPESEKEILQPQEILSIVSEFAEFYMCVCWWFRLKVLGLAVVFGFYGF